MSLLGVKRGEEKTLLPALGVAFLSVGALGLSTIASDTLFVSTFSLGEVSRFYVVGSLTRVASAFAYAAIVRRAVARAKHPELASARLDRLLLAATAWLIAGSGIAAFQGGPAVIYAVCIAQLVLPPLLPLIAFNAVLNCFHARQAKRLLPLVAAAATVGAIAVSGGASLLAVTIGTPGLLLMGGVLAALAIPLPVILGRLAQPSGDPVAAPASEAAGPPEVGGFFQTLRDTASDVRTVPVVRIVVLFAFLGAALANFTDFSFKAALKAEYSRDEIAAFMGIFGMVSNGAILVVQILLTSRFVARFGIRTALSTSPALLLALSPAIIFAPGVVVATALRFAEMVGRYSVGNSCADLLLTPTDRDVRTRAKVVVKGASSPLGYFASGIVLTAFGASGPPPVALVVLLVLTSAVLIFTMADARRAYAQALARAIGRGRLVFDVSADGAGVLRSELTRMLSESAKRGDRRGTLRTLDIMSDRFFALSDLRPAFESTDVEIREASLATALRLARAGEGGELLELIPPGDDPALERRVLQTARTLGTVIPESRISRALEATSDVAEDDIEAIELWTEGLIASVERARSSNAPDARKVVDASVKKLRKAALGDDGPRRASALRALGELREARAEREVLRAMASPDPEVFAEAAKSAVLIDASGVIPSLVMRLTAGPHIRASGRALSMAGPAAINELISALPTTRGEGAIAPTAIASEHAVTGTIRAARVLARIGPDACERVLARFSDLGYRARNAVARSFATVSLSKERAVDESVVQSAMDLVLSYAERLMEAWPQVGLRVGGGRGLLAREISHRLSETSERILDLASVIRDRALIARTRAALTGGARDRANALELLENLLPHHLALRTGAVLEHEAAGVGEGSAVSRPTTPAPAPADGPAFDGWLKKCHQFDRGELPSDDPMLGVLEKVLVLREASLFVGLSGEELYPVAEIATAERFDAGQDVVKQGDPGDALYVVASGAFDIIKDDTKLRALSDGDVFGEMALLDGAPRAATVRASTDGELLRIPRAEFEALLDQSPELARGVIRTLLGHLRGA